VYCISDSEVARRSVWTLLEPRLGLTLEMAQPWESLVVTSKPAPHETSTLGSEATRLDIRAIPVV